MFFSRHNETILSLHSKSKKYYKLNLGKHPDADQMSFIAGCRKLNRKISDGLGNWISLPALVFCDVSAPLIFSRLVFSLLRIRHLQPAIPLTSSVARWSLVRGPITVTRSMSPVSPIISFWTTLVPMASGRSVCASAQPCPCVCLSVCLPCGVCHSSVFLFVSVCVLSVCCGAFSSFGRPRNLTTSFFYLLWNFGLWPKTPNCIINSHCPIRKKRRNHSAGSCFDLFVCE